jgi:23S rRNA (guanosine2251-2'-O)-methyltransferase
VTTETALVFGLHTVQAVLQSQASRVTGILLQRGRGDARIEAIEQLARAAGIAIERKETRELDQLSGNARHQGVIARLAAAGPQGEGALDDVLDQAGPLPFVLVLDGVQDPHNLGACLRTADAAGVHAVVVPRDRAAGLSPTVRKVASGAAESTPLIHVVNLARTLRHLKDRGLWVVGTADEATQDVYAADLKGPLALVMGSEGEGLRRLTREHCDSLVRIPMAGSVASLNVSVATGVLLFEAVRQRRA